METKLAPLKTGRDYKNVINNSLVADIETNALVNPDRIHLVVTQDVNDDTEGYFNIHKDEAQRSAFYQQADSYEYLIGHNFLDYDLPVMDNLADGHRIARSKVVDTLVLSRLFKYNIPGGHSLDAWGSRLGIKKEGADITDFSELTPLLQQRAYSDIKINKALLKRFQRFLDDPSWHPAIELEHEIAWVCREMRETGFPFDKAKAEKMKEEILVRLNPMDDEIARSFPPVPVPIREIHPRRTKDGKLHKQDFRWYDGPIEDIFTGGPFTTIEFVPFNSGSPKQVVDRLNKAGWKPTEPTKGHAKALKEWKKLPKEKQEHYQRFGWKICEANLNTLPADAPTGARLIAQRLILSSRLSDIDEWLTLAVDHGDHYRIHGTFNSIGAWTHRLSHAKPNLANIPVAHPSPTDTEFETFVNKINDEMRGCFVPAKGMALIGTDADGLQMRIFAHIVNDRRLIDALIKGSKADKTDIHSVHQRALGDVCATRDVAKTFIYAFLLGAGIRKVAEIFSCSISEAKTAVDNFLEFYPSLADLKKNVIPRDAERGYFIGLDGRKVACDSEHLMLAGYLQNGESIIMKRACVRWRKQLKDRGIPFELYTWPHDEWQTGVPDDEEIIKEAMAIQAQSIADQADELQLNCPLEGSSSFGYSWKETH